MKLKTYLKISAKRRWNQLRLAGSSESTNLVGSLLVDVHTRPTPLSLPLLDRTSSPSKPYSLIVVVSYDPTIFSVQRLPRDELVRKFGKPRGCMYRPVAMEIDGRVSRTATCHVICMLLRILLIAFVAFEEDRDFLRVKYRSNRASRSLR